MSCDLFWSYPIRLPINEEGKTVYDLHGEYRHFLNTNQPEHSNRFHDQGYTEKFRSITIERKNQ